MGSGVVAVFAVASTVGGAACSGGPSTSGESVGATAAAITNGTPVNAEQSGVVRIQTAAGQTCSGVLLTNDVVVTAGDNGACMDGNSRYGAPWTTTLTMGSQVRRAALGWYELPGDTMTFYFAETPFLMNGATTGYTLPLATSSPPVGSDLTCYGYGSGATPALSSGLFAISEVNPLNTGEIYLQELPNGAAFEPGDTGAPCFTSGPQGPLQGLGLGGYEGGPLAMPVLIRNAASAYVPAFGWSPTAPPGVESGRAEDIGQAGFDYCAGAAAMCSAGRVAEYGIYAASCRAALGTPPPCSATRSATGSLSCTPPTTARWAISRAGSCTRARAPTRDAPRRRAICPRRSRCTRSTGTSRSRPRGARRSRSARSASGPSTPRIPRA